MSACALANRHPCHTAGSWVRNLNNTRPYLDERHPLSRPGCWQTPDNLEVGRVEAPPLHGGGSLPGCTTKPQPCPNQKGHTFCLSDPAPHQCDNPPKLPCPPCPAPAPPPARGDVTKDQAFFSWNRAHYGAWIITSSPLILGMDLTDAKKLERFLDVVGNREAIAVNQACELHPLACTLLAPAHLACMSFTTCMQYTILQRRKHVPV
jgi:hypothetical protein